MLKNGVLSTLYADMLSVFLAIKFLMLQNNALSSFVFLNKHSMSLIQRKLRTQGCLYHFCQLMNTDSSLPLYREYCEDVHLSLYINIYTYTYLCVFTYMHKFNSSPSIQV